MKNNLLLISIFLFPNLVHSQLVNLNQAIGAKFSYNYTFGEESNMELSISYATYKNISSNENFNIIPSVQTSLNIYYNGIGTNKFKDNVEYDLNNSFAITTGLDKNVFDKTDHKFWRNGFYFLNQTYSKNVNIIPLDNFASVTLATNFLINKNKRNQQYGALILQPIPFLRLQYCNDGGPWINDLKIGDRYDRWWTGYGYIEIGNDINTDSLSNFGFSKVRISYERFTWDNNIAYEMSSKLGFPQIPLSKDKAASIFQNSGKYNLELFFGHGIFSMAAINLIKDGQDTIHDKRKYSKHPTLFSKYWSLGYTQNLRY